VVLSVPPNLGGGLAFGGVPRLAQAVHLARLSRCPSWDS
jgi:hypothetical protein